MSEDIRDVVAQRNAARRQRDPDRQLWYRRLVQQLDEGLSDEEWRVLHASFAKVLWACVRHTGVLSESEADSPDPERRGLPLREALGRCLVLAALAAQHRLDGEPTFSTLDGLRGQLLGFELGLPQRWQREEQSQGQTEEE